MLTDDSLPAIVYMVDSKVNFTWFLNMNTHWHSPQDIYLDKRTLSHWVNWHTTVNKNGYIELSH